MSSVVTAAAADSPDASSIGDVAEAVAHFEALFGPQEAITIRPVESWTEGGKKHSRVDYDGIRPIYLNGNHSASLLNVLLRCSRELTNSFYGVCPRLPRSHGGMERAWQIRTVRCLWCDIDDISVDDAITRMTDAKLPKPSIVVNSGHGAHVYWLLDQPYQIDDAGDPPPVKKEWIKGTKKPFEYFINSHGDKVYLRDPKTGRTVANAEPKLSPKAQRVQDIVQGIAHLIGGDSTHDLSRLLRIPGSLNRKEQRTGRTPTPCRTVYRDATLRYSIEQFAHCGEEAPDRKRRERAAAMPLPSPKKLTPTRADNLAQHIAACKIAEDRSKADFALCCYAVEHGIPAEELWSRVSDVGKFSERGRDYFDMTMQKAEDATRVKALQRIEREEQERAEKEELRSAASGQSPDDPDDVPSGNRIIYNPEVQPVSWLFSEVTTRLSTCGYCYSRAGRPVTIHGDEVTAIDDTASLAAALCSCSEFMLVEVHGENVNQTYQPLPPKYGAPWLKDSRQAKKLPPVNLFTRCPCYINTSTGWRITQPGYDHDTGIYYAGPVVTPSDSTEHIDNVLKEFCWRTPGDRTNFIGMMLTLVLIHRFIGCKPGILLMANKQGTGKSKLAQILSIIRSAAEAPTIAFIDREEELEKRFGSVVRSGVETLIVDNAKTNGNRGSQGEVSSAIMDRVVTDSILSFRLLGSSTDIRVENSHILAVTANTISISRDLITRLVPVNLYYEGDPTKRAFAIENPEGYVAEHRFEIVAELLGMVDRWIKSGCPLNRNIRTRFEAKGWGATIGGILDANGEPDFMANTDEAAEELDQDRQEFAGLVDVMARIALGVEWTTTEILATADESKILTAELGDGGERSRTTRLGKFLSRFAGMTFRVAGRAEHDPPRTVELKSLDRRNGKHYLLRECPK